MTTLYERAKERKEQKDVLYDKALIRATEEAFINGFCMTRQEMIKKNKSKASIFEYPICCFTWVEFCSRHEFTGTYDYIWFCPNCAGSLVYLWIISHDKEDFFQYCIAETIKQVGETRKLTTEVIKKEGNNGKDT